MKQNKGVAFLLFLLMLCTAIIPALAEHKPTVTELRGLVTEVIDGGFIMEDVNLGTVLLNVDPETVLEGVLTEKPLKKGMYVIALSNGIFTRSLPPQTHADRVGCYPLEGTVSELLEEGILLTGDPIFGEVIVRLTSAMPHVFLGVPLTVYYDGAMTMSLPGKVNARHVIVPVVSGKVKNVGEDSLRLEAADGEAYTVQLSASTLLPASFFDETLSGKNVLVYHNGKISADGVLNALEIVDPSRIMEETEPLDGTLEEEPATTEAEPSEEDMETPERTPAPKEENPEAVTPDSPEEPAEDAESVEGGEKAMPKE